MHYPRGKIYSEAPPENFFPGDFLLIFAHLRQPALTATRANCYGE